MSKKIGGAMDGVMQVEVTIDVVKAPEPKDLLEALEAALKEVEKKYPGAIKFSRMRFTNIATGFEVKKEAGT